MAASIGGLAAAHVVERQLRNWEIGRSQRQADETGAARSVEDFIAISREVGLDDSAVPALLAERFGWPVFDRELLHHMAGDDAVRRQIYASMDERDLGWMEESLRSLMHAEFVRNDYFHRLAETVLTLARQGRAIFVGRGADLILPRDYGLRVRLTASPEHRARRLASQQGLNIDDARRALARIRADRDEFIRHHFRVDPADPARFDLCINAERFTPQHALELILSAAEAHGITKR